MNMLNRNSKRASLQLSMNFTIMLILALVVFGLGLSFLYKIVGDLGDKADALDTRTESQINNILTNTGVRVAFPKKTIDLRRGEHGILGVGIKNDLKGNVNSENEFFLITKCKKAYDDNIEICDDDDQSNSCDSTVCDNWITKPDALPSTADDEESRGTKETIPRNEKKISRLFINVPKQDVEAGTYIFNLYVRYKATDGGFDDFDTGRKFYVNVK